MSEGKPEVGGRSQGSGVGRQLGTKDYALGTKESVVRGPSSVARKS